MALDQAFTLDQIFSGAGILALCGWIALALSPLRPALAQLIAARFVPIMLGLAYAALLFRFWGEAAGGFGSLGDVGALFSHRGLLLAGWLHYLAFDLLVGAWEVREARRSGLPHLAVLPCLALTFLFGPIGFLTFLALRSVWLRGLSRRQGEPA
ncbi:ABA4-like family protein [Labrys portucalensis]|uniref:ABA4-like family protein n=1 Tax=Labrys neptuniae TaxID=376174 RepID=A0ABV6ZLH1_9HYPH